MKYKVKIHKPQPISKYFVYFDMDTGEIASITNKKDPNNEIYFEMPTQEVEDFLIGTRNLTKHKVIFDVKEQRYQIVSKNESLVVYADDLIFKIPTLQGAQILVTQDIKNKKWIVAVSDIIRTNMESIGARLEEHMFFSVTEKGNPNILYNHFYISIREVIEKSFIEIPFTSQEEYVNNKVSVYTNRKFDRYTHEVIDE